LPGTTTTVESKEGRKTKMRINWRVRKELQEKAKMAEADLTGGAVRTQRVAAAVQRGVAIAAAAAAAAVVVVATAAAANMRPSSVVRRWPEAKRRVPWAPPWMEGMRQSDRVRLM